MVATPARVGVLGRLARGHQDTTRGWRGNNGRRLVVEGGNPSLK